MVGKGMQMASAKGECVWILLKVDGNQLHLVTPKTHKPHGPRRLLSTAP